MGAVTRGGEWAGVDPDELADVGVWCGLGRVERGLEEEEFG